VVGGDGDEHVPKRILHGQNAVGRAGNPSRAGLVIINDEIALLAPLGGFIILGEEGDVVDSNGKERSKPLRLRILW
jgi:hypothetical protein